jgi:hypothetical protein
MPHFSEPLLIQIVIKAARRVNRKLGLTCTQWEITIDPADGEMLTPDPDENQDLYDIVLMQAECLISQREFQTELRNAEGGIMIRDGEQVVDQRAAGVARGTFYNSDYSPCAELKQCIRDMKLNGPGCQSGGPGKLVW